MFVWAVSVFSLRHHYYIRITIQWPRILAENQGILSWKRNLRIPSQGVWRGQAKYTVWLWLQMQCSFTACLVLSQVISYFLTLSSIRCVRKHLTGGFLCAVLDLSGILCSSLIPEHSGIKRRGKPLRDWGIQAFPSLAFLYGDKYPLPSCEPHGKSDCLQISLFNMDCLCFVSLEF